MLFISWLIPDGSLIIYFFTKMGSHCIYGTISFFHLCAVVNLFWLESFSVCLSRIGFETFIALTLVHGVNFETILSSISGIISPQYFFFSTHLFLYSLLNFIDFGCVFFVWFIISFPKIMTSLHYESTQSLPEIPQEWGNVYSST